MKRQTNIEILILENGRTITVEFKYDKGDDMADDVWGEIVDEMHEAIRNKDIWFCGNWSDVFAKYGETYMNWINMEKVVGIM